MVIGRMPVISSRVFIVDLLLWLSWSMKQKVNLIFI